VIVEALLQPPGVDDRRANWCRLGVLRVHGYLWLNVSASSFQHGAFHGK